MVLVNHAQVLIILNICHFQVVQSGGKNIELATMKRGEAMKVCYRQLRRQQILQSHKIIFPNLAFLCARFWTLKRWRRSYRHWRKKRRKRRRKRKPQPAQHPEQAGIPSAIQVLGNNELNALNGWGSSAIFHFINNGSLFFWYKVPI